MLTNVMHKINGVIDKIYMTAAGLLFIVLIISSTLQVFTRYFLNSSLVGTEELARYCFVWMSLLGGSIAVGRWAHTSISVIYDRLPPVPQKCMRIVHNILVLVLCYIFIKGGFTMMKVSFLQSTPTLHIPKWIIYLAVPLSGIGMALHALEHICKTIDEFIEKSRKEIQA